MKNEKIYLYECNGIELESNAAFGTTFTIMLSIAKKSGSEIWRTTLIDGKVKRREFFSKGKVFLNEVFYSPEKAYHC